MGTLQPLAWQNIGTSDTVLNWILEGVPLHVVDPPHKCNLPNRVTGFRAESFVDQEVTNLLLQDRIQPFSAEQAHCILPLTVVSKKGGKLRLVLDCRHLNQAILCPSFKQEGLDFVSSQIRSGDRLLSTDISSGFYHLRIVPSERKFLCFR